MCNHDQRRAVFAAKFEQQIKHRIGRGAVEIAGGFIGEQAGRSGDQCARHGDALALAAGEFAGTVRQAMAEADALQYGGCFGQCFLAIHAADQQRHGDIFQRGKLGQQVMELVDEAQ